MYRRCFRQGRRDKKSMRHALVLQTFAAYEYSATLFIELPAVALVILDRTRGSDRSQPVRLQAGIADTQSTNFLLHFVDEGISDHLVGIDARQGRTFLSAHAECRTDDAGGRALQIGTRRD